MQRHRLIAPMVLLTLLTVAGCKPDAAPGGAAPGGVAPAVAPLTNGEKHIRIKKKGNNWGTHQFVEKGEKVVWKGDTGFDVVFDPNENPCVKSTTGVPDTYTSVPPTAGHPRYEAKCIILDSPTAGEYDYQIVDDPASTRSPAHRAAPARGARRAHGARRGEFGRRVHGLSITPCYGCTLDVNSDN